MKINGNAVRPGMVIEHQDRLWRAIKIQHTQPGKGGAYLQVELKDLQSGTKLNERFRAAETVERAHLEQRDYQYLFEDAGIYTFMDNESYEQITMDTNMIGEDRIPYLQENMQVIIESHEDVPIGVQLADTVVLDQGAVGRISRVDALQAQAMAKAGLERMKQRLVRVESALERFDEDAEEFDICPRCEEPIGLRRLQAVPESIFCVQCAGGGGARSRR